MWRPPRRQLAIAKANLPDLQRQIGLTEDQLSVLLGHNPDQVLRTPLQTPGTRPRTRASAPVPAAGLPSSLLERRPDLREAEQNLVAANAQVGVAKANLFPTITLTGTGGGASTALSSLFTGPARLWSVGGSALQPLLNSQRNLYQLELADAQKRQALLQYQKSVQSAFQEVSDALIARAAVRRGADPGTDLGRPHSAPPTPSHWRATGSGTRRTSMSSTAIATCSAPSYRSRPRA